MHHPNKVLAPFPNNLRLSAMRFVLLLDSGSPRFELGSPGPEPGSLPS